MKTPSQYEQISSQMHHRKKPTKILVATGPEGFEPPTTWLKARRSTELSYEPRYLKMYSIITMPVNYLNILSDPVRGGTGQFRIPR